MEKMLEILERRPDSMFDMFCRALNETSQGHIVRMLKNNLQKNQSVSQSASDTGTVEHMSQQQRVTMPTPSTAAEFGELKSFPAIF